jgi:3-hydroxyisobutyrate dehydrogenase-like beta-hydroxyacid dehydrogenase
MNIPPSSSVAVLGLGLIGSVWARHLRAAGRLTACWNRTPQTGWRESVATPGEAAERADTVLVVVADPPAVASVIAAMAPALTPRHLVIQSSTIGPADSAAMFAAVTATGARYLEAPFTGSKPAAEQKQTVFYLGGEPAEVAAAEPALSLISARRIPVGTGEQACTVKLAMNLQIAVQAEALCEALHTARRAGVSDDTFFSCMKGNASWSGVAALKEPKLRTADYAPQFSVKHLLKDLRLLRTAAGPLPALDTLIDRLTAAANHGHADHDFIALYHGLERG